MSLGAWIGVDLFFVISGFLITLILIRVKDGTGFLLVFWQRRALRIFPLAGLYLVALLVLIRLGDPLNMLPRFDAWPWYAFYLGNIHIALYGWQPLAVMILWSALFLLTFFYLKKTDRSLPNWGLAFFILSIQPVVHSLAAYSVLVACMVFWLIQSSGSVLLLAGLST